LLFRENTDATLISAFTHRVIDGRQVSARCWVKLRRGDEAALIAALQPWLSPTLGSASSLNYKPMRPEVLSTTSLELGSNGAWGRLVVGAARASFPCDLEKILLRVAGNQACVALMEDSHPMRWRETGPEDVGARAPQVNPNPAALKDNLVVELRSLARLHQFSTSLIAADDPTTVLKHMLNAAIDVQSAGFGNVELFDAELGGLVIIAQRNFQPAFLNHLARLRQGTSRTDRHTNPERAV
jgi:hypothetical protein